MSSTGCPKNVARSSATPIVSLSRKPYLELLSQVTLHRRTAELPSKIMRGLGFVRRSVKEFWTTVITGRERNLKSSSEQGLRNIKSISDDWGGQ